MKMLKFALVLLAASLLGGCAVYGPYPQGYYQDAPAYSQPGYYVGPPVQFGLDFGYWGGDGWGRDGGRGGGHDGRGHGGHGGR